MESNCNGCTQKVKQQIEQKESTYKQAQALADAEKEWVAIYTDEYGATQYTTAAIAIRNGIFVKEYVSPNNANVNV